MNSLFKKIIFYERLIKLLVFLTVFSVVVGSVAGVHYLVRGLSLKERLQGLQAEQMKLHDLQSQTLKTMSELGSSDSYIRRRSQEILQESLLKAPDFVGKDRFVEPSQKQLSQEQLMALQTAIGKAIVAGETGQVEMILGQNIYSWQLGLIAFLTLLFGVFIPGMLVKRLAMRAQKAKAQAEVAVGKWLSEYIAQTSEPEAFKNPEFWLRMFLVTAETMAPYWNHPVLNWIKESGPLIRAEFEKLQHEANRHHPKRKAS